MGGSGSGRWGDYAARARVESCFTVAAPRGEVAEGQQSRSWWPRSGVTLNCSVTLGGASPLVSLRHDYAGGGSQLVALVSTPANLGGRRWWFRCPGCSARVRTLHLPRGSFASHEFKCRGCHNLGYESAQSSGSHARSFFLLRARALGCSYRPARDGFRRESLKLGAGLYESRRLRFEHQPAEGGEDEG